MKIPENIGEILLPFTDPAVPFYKQVMAQWSYSGDGTQAWDDRLRVRIGAEAAEHYHWKTLVCDGTILLVIPHYRHPGVPAPEFQLPVEVMWCLNQVSASEDVSVATSAWVRKVHSRTRAKVKTLDGVEWMKVERLNYWQSSSRRRKPRRMQKKAPKGYVFFRWKYGVGCVDLDR